MQLRVLTLNIWGVRFVAKLIDERIRVLIEHLTNPEVSYDIIGLQEVWSKGDYARLCKSLKTVYPHSHYFLSGLIGSGCCFFSKYPIIGVYEHRYSLNGFPHKIQHGDWFCGKLIGLCKILVNGYVVNVYNTHLHANYHHVIPKDIYLGHRICQAYELIQFIESTSSADTTHLTILLGDLNLKSDELGFQLIKGILQFNDSFLQRTNKDIYDPTVGNSGLTCDLLDNPYVKPYSHQGEGQRIDYILYRARDENVECVEAYPTLNKVPNNPLGLHYSDHLAVYALFNINDKLSAKRSTALESIQSIDDETREHLRSACIIVEESIQRIQRHRLFCVLLVFLLPFIIFSFNGHSLSNGYFFSAFVILKNLFALIGIAVCVWFIGLGKPVERNALQMAISRQVCYVIAGIIATIVIDVYTSSSSYMLMLLALIRALGICVAFFCRIIFDDDEKKAMVNTKKNFWIPFKNLFDMVTAAQELFIVSYIPLSLNLWTILCIVEQIAMALFANWWIHKIEKEDLRFLKYAWSQIFGSSSNQGSSLTRIDEFIVLKRLLRYSFEDWTTVTLGAALLLAAALSDVFVPLYTGRLLSSVAFKEAWLQFRYNLIMFIIVNFAGGFLGGARQGVFSVCISRLSIRIKTKLFAAYLRQEIGFFDTNESGKLLSRLNHDTQVMSSTVANNIAQCVGALFRFIGTVAMMVRLSMHLTVACIIGAPLILVVAKICGNIHRRVSERTQNLSADASQIADETIQNIRTVRSFGNEKEELERFEKTLQQSYQIAVIQAVLTAAQRWFVDLAQLCMSIIMLAYGAKLVRDNYITGPDLLAFIIYQLTLGSILSDISQIYTSLMSAAGSSHSVFEYLDRQPVQKASGTLQPEEFHGDIEFKNVSLVYPARPDETAIQNISFKMKAGQTCAFVGPSGSGKSTCINLLERFYDPTEGTILLDGREIHEYDHKYLHEKLAMVGQEPVLFNRSIRENINYAISDADEQSIVQAAEEANAHGFITELTHGYNTQCGQRGGHLSGGQKQRVSIARAVVRKPTVLLLDEATSALDPVNERLIQDALFYNREQQSPRTVLISAHRLSTIERCDRIFVIHKSRLIEQGTHDELMMIENGIYRELVRRQQMNLDED